MPDYDDCLKMKELALQYDEIAMNKNAAIQSWTTSEIILNKGIIKHKISERWSWKKQILELCKIDNDYETDIENYYSNKSAEKMMTNTLKSIENQINILKKIYESTPKYK
jgi:hypothetical protein